MKLADLTVGETYYHESRSGDWSRTRSRDVQNRRGGHKVVLLGKDTYYRTSPWSTTFYPAREGRRGSIVKVRILAAEDTEHAWVSNREDREDYVTLASIRGQWDRVVEETTALETRRRIQEEERQDAERLERVRVQAIVTWAETVGLTVTANTTRFVGQRRTFTLTEENLVAFLGGLENTLKENSE